MIPRPPVAAGRAGGDAERAGVLQRATAALANAASLAEVADLAVHTATALGVAAGSLLLRGEPPDDDALDLVQAVNYPAPLVAPWRRLRADAPLPFAEAARTGRPVYVATRDEFARRYPALAADLPRTGDRAVAALPLLVRDRVLGVLGLAFRDDRPGGAFAPADRAALEAVAAQAAQAVYRVRLAASERAARRALEEREAQLRALADNQPDALLYQLVRDADGVPRYTYVSASVERLRGVTAAAVLADARTLTDQVEPLHRAALEVASARSRASLVPFRVEVPVRLPNGEVRWRMLAARPRRLADGATAFDGVEVDVTERRLAELDREFLLDLTAALQGESAPEALAAEAVRRVAAQFGAIRVHFAEVDERARAYRTLAEHVAAGLDPLHGGASAGGAFDDFPPLVMEATRAGLSRVDDTATDPATAEYHAAIYEPLGIRAVLGVGLVQGGRWAATLAVAAGEPRPWTDRETDLLRAAAGRLWPAYEAVRARAQAERAREQAEQARAEAERASRAKSEFLAVMSHELRTPLNAIAGHAQLVEMGIHGPVTDAQRDALARLARAQRHLLALVNDVLNLSRIEAGRVDYDVHPADVGELVGDVAAMVAPQLAGRGLTLDCPPGDRLCAHVDADKARQILLNLLGNAAKFTPAVGPDGRPGRVRVTVAARDGRVEVRVADTGVGIPAARLPHVFEPFVRVDSSLTRATEGAGLGLAIARDLARGMGGELTVESVVGVGSTFTLALRQASL